MELSELLDASAVTILEPNTKAKKMNTKITICVLLTGSLLSQTKVGFAQAQPVNTAASAPIALAMPAANVGQTITLNSTSYTVKAKKQLAPDVEYYTMKSVLANATAPSFLRIRGTYEPTVFAQAQFEAFFKTGMLSSFGKLKTQTVNGKTVNFVQTGGRTVVFILHNGKDRVLVREMPANAALEGPILSPTGSEENRRCWDGCDMIWASCDEDAGVVVIDDPASCGQGQDACVCNQEACYWRCNRDIPRHQFPAIYSIKMTRTVLMK